jgi:hypothetical protein
MAGESPRAFDPLRDPRLKPDEEFAGVCTCCNQPLVKRPNETPLILDTCSDCLTCDKDDVCEWSFEGQLRSFLAWHQYVTRTSLEAAI